MKTGEIRYAERAPSTLNRPLLPLEYDFFFFFFLQIVRAPNVRTIRRRRYAAIHFSLLTLESLITRLMTGR